MSKTSQLIGEAYAALNRRDIDGGIAKVRVHQVVKSLDGNVLFDGDVWHIYTVLKNLILRMDIEDAENNS